MNLVDLPESLLAQMGGQVWQERLKTAQPISQEPFEEEAISEAAPLLEAVVAKTQDAVQSPLSKSNDYLPFILIAPGLEAIWENSESSQWQLLTQIATVFNWELEKVLYFDTALIVTEEAVLATLEEIFEQSINVVFSMDTDSPLTQMLSEAFEVVTLPSFEQMLEDGYAKKMVYQTLLEMR